MHTMTPETQLRAYASLRSLETRALAIEEAIDSIKRSFLHGGLSGMAEMIASTAELRWQMRQVADLANVLDEQVGVQRSGESSTARSPETPEPRGMRGTTDVLSVADLVGILSTLQKTGTLALQADEAMFVFEFQEGKIVHAVTNQVEPDIRLGTILVAQNKLTEQQLEQCLVECSQANDLLGVHLVHSATVSETDLRAALDVQVQRIFEQAFNLPFARFSFVDGSISNIAQRTVVNVTHLLLETARIEDEAASAACQKSRKAYRRDKLDRILGG